MNGADYILLNRFLPGRRGLENKEYLLTFDETNEALEIIEEVLSKAGKCGHVGTELPCCLVRNRDQYKHLQMSYMCGAAKTFFVVDPSGYVKVCNHSERRLCKVDDIKNLYADPYWQIFARRSYDLAACKGCGASTICDGGCREAANIYLGDVRAIDPCFVLSRKGCTPIEGVIPSD